MAAFYLYVDESGKAHRDEYISLCGYVAHAIEWGRVAMEWNNCRTRWQIPALHMSQIYGRFPKKPWQDVRTSWGTRWEPKRDIMLKEFSNILLRASVVGVGVVVDSKHFKQLPETEFKIVAKDPLFLAFQTIVMKAIEKTEVIDTHSDVAIVIDDDRDDSLECYRRLDDLKRHPHPQFAKVKDRVHAMTFADDDSYPGLQAADMLAYESRRFMIDRIADPELAPSERFQCLTMFGISQVNFFNAEKLDELATLSNLAIKENL